MFTVVGFPHGPPASLDQNLAVVRRIRALGVTDLAVAHSVALPATELFDSLYDSWQIRLDATHVGHRLQGGIWCPRRATGRASAASG